MVVLTMMEQRLLVSLLKKPVTSKEQKIYKQRTSFYIACWKLRDIGLISPIPIKINGEKMKLWKLTLDGTIVARILAKDGGYRVK
jgi:hypothetical protein